MEWSAIHQQGVSWRKQIVGEISDAFTIPRYVRLFYDTFGDLRGASFFEVGSGNGDVPAAILAANRGQIGRYVTSEFFSEGVKWLQGRGLDAVQGDAERLDLASASFFRRFPLACSVEFSAYDVFCPGPDHMARAWPRAEEFERMHLVKDPCWQALYRMGTHPLGSRGGGGGPYGDHVLICYNLPEDLPVLAQRRGERFWRYFGPEWQYVRDRQMNDWMTIEAQGTVFVGNMGTNPASVSLEMPVAAAPGDGQLVVSSRDSGGVAFNLPALRMVTLSLTNILVNPGTNAVSFRFRGTAPDQPTRLLVQGVTVKESTVPSDR